MNALAGGYGDFGEDGQCKKIGKTWGAATVLRAGMVLGLLAGAALPVDGPLAKWVQKQQAGMSSRTPLEGGGNPSEQGPPSARWKIPSDLKRVLSWAEGFGHALGVVLLALVIYQIAPDRRRALGRAVCMALASGLAADGIKLLVARTRPRAFDLSQPILDSFTGLLPGLAGGSGSQSFPSAHVATATGWALGLGWVYPRGKWIFVFFAFLVLCQRLEANAHFLSDCLAGAAVGCLASSLFLPGGWLSRRWDRWESSGRPFFAANPPQSAHQGCSPPTCQPIFSQDPSQEGFPGA